MVKAGGEPEYEILAELLREHIRRNLAIGDRLPSRTELRVLFGRNEGIVRQAVDRLKVEGVLAGSQGKAGFEIVKMPGEPDPMTADDATLRRMIAELRSEVRQFGQEVAALRREVGRAGP